MNLNSELTKLTVLLVNERVSLKMSTDNLVQFIIDPLRNKMLENENPEKMLSSKLLQGKKTNDFEVLKNWLGQNGYFTNQIFVMNFVFYYILKYFHQQTMISRILSAQFHKYFSFIIPIGEIHNEPNGT